jgi:hypothetical protein
LETACPQAVRGLAVSLSPAQGRAGSINFPRDRRIDAYSGIEQLIIFLL